MDNDGYQKSKEDLKGDASSWSKSNIELSTVKDGQKEGDGKKEAEVSDQGKKRRRFIIEPVMMLYLASYSTMAPLTSQYVLSVMMKEYNVTGGSNGTSRCGQVDTNSTYFQQQQKAQGASAQFSLFYDISQGIPAMIVALFLGSYTDRKGRRLALILPTIGVIIRCGMFVIQQGFKLPLWVTIIGTTLEGLSGSATIMITTCYAYVSDITTKEERSSRIMILECCMNAFQGVLQLLMGYVISGLGYFWPFIFLICFHVINLFYISCFVPESRSKKKDGRPLTPFLIIESFKTVTRKRTFPYKRSLLLLCLAAFTFLMLGIAPQYGVENLYLLNAPLCMDSILVGYWKTARLVIHSTTLVVFAKFVLPRVGDENMVIISSLSIMVYYVLFSLATQVWMSFVVLIPGFGARSILPVIRTIISKMVSSDEQGGLISVLYVIEKVIGIVGASLFKSLYAASLQFFRGTAHMCLAATVGIGLSLIILFKCIKPKPIPEEENPKATQISEKDDEVTSQRF